MPQTNFNLGLFGKKYLDTNYYIDNFHLSETNIPYKINKSSGGIYNFKKINKKINFYYFEDGITEAKIISDLKTSTRTSILEKTKNNSKVNIKHSLIDWLHISYLDDLKNIKCIDYKNPISVDFCKNEDRKKYVDILNKCEFIFDSRERKPLYKNLNISGPIIFHDPYGCECVINNKIIYSYSCSPLKNINVNGAGDLFCGIFLYYAYNNDIATAIEKSCEETTKILKK
tara:strand:+ start:784 stop:1470 length:687 start_codon:yes stop_codon:yes gene_type:complete